MNLSGIWECYDRETCHVPSDASFYPGIAAGPDGQVWRYAVKPIEYYDESVAPNYKVTTSVNYGLLLYEQGRWNFIRADHIGLSNRLIKNFACDWTGALWLNMTGEILGRFDGKNLEIFLAGERGVPPEFALGGLSQFASGGENNFWLALPDIGACRFTGTVWECFTSQNSGLPDGWVTGVTVDGAGRAWFAVGNMKRTSFVRYAGGRWEEVVQLPIGRKQYEARLLAVDHQEKLWVGWIRPQGQLNKLGLWAFDPATEQWSQYKSSNSGSPDHQIESMTVDKAGRVWVGTRFGIGVFDGIESGCWNYVTPSVPTRPLRRPSTAHKTRGKDAQFRPKVSSYVAMDTEGHIWAEAGIGANIATFTEIKEA